MKGLIKNSRWISRLLPLLWLALITLIFAVWTKGNFVELYNLKILLDQALIVGTVATGAAFIYASGNVNLAMGACTALVATVVARLYLVMPSVVLMILVSVVFGVVLMAISAFLSTKLNVRVMFVTIVMMTLLSAIQRSIVGAETISLPYEMTKVMKNAYFSYIAFGIFFVICCVLFYFFDIGRALKFLGTNLVCAEQTGHYRRKYLMIAFVIAGVGVGLASVMTIVRTGSISINTASTLNMDCMLALVLGGMSIFGGSKSYLYAGIIGALTVSALNNGLNMVGVSPDIIQGIRGILFMVFICTAQKRPQGLPAPEG